MFFEWQTILALLCVMAAVVAVAKRAHGWLSGSRESSCSSCPARKAPTIVTLGSLNISPTLKARAPGQGTTSTAQGS